MSVYPRPRRFQSYAEQIGGAVRRHGFAATTVDYDRGRHLWHVRYVGERGRGVLHAPSRFDMLHKIEGLPWSPPEQRTVAYGAALVAAARCVRCGRPLTVRAVIPSGGPEELRLALAREMEQAPHRCDECRARYARILQWSTRHYTVAGVTP